MKIKNYFPYTRKRQTRIKTQGEEEKKKEFFINIISHDKNKNKKKNDNLIERDNYRTNGLISNNTIG